ncbi:MAG: hypothetical protein QOK16_611 [Solirubrobacteraceae bacterium]|nr:hypothetical protein [Solirubrobacteraceae bacterium]
MCTKDGVGVPPGSTMVRSNSAWHACGPSCGPTDTRLDLHDAVSFRTLDTVRSG